LGERLWDRLSGLPQLDFGDGDAGAENLFHPAFVVAGCEQEQPARALFRPGLEKGFIFCYFGLEKILMFFWADRASRDF
jgi:hypothetical protein